MRTSTKLNNILSKGEVTFTRKKGPDWSMFVTIEGETGIFQGRSFSMVIDQAYRFTKKNFKSKGNVI